MKPQYFTLSLALAASSASASIFPRALQDVLDGISNISKNTQALKASLDKYTGNVNDAVPITQASSTLDKSVKDATDAAKGTSTLSDSDATSVLDAISSLIPNVIDSVNAFVAKQGTLDTAGLGEIAKTDIKMLQSDSNDFAAALISIAPSASQAAASSLSSCIDNAFKSAEASSTAQSCEGGAAPTGSSGGSSSSGGAMPTSTSGGGAAKTSMTSSGAAAATSTGAASSSHGSMGGIFGAVFAAAGAFAL